MSSKIINSKISDKIVELVEKIKLNKKISEINEEK